MGAFESAVTTEPRAAYEAGDFEQVAQEKPKQARQIYAEYENDEERRQANLEADMYTAAFFWPMPEGTDWAPTYGELFRLQREGPGAIPDEQRARIEAIAEQNKFFHWHLEFPEVFGDDRDGGFDVVLGNPPWERIKLQDKEFFATKAPAIAAAQTASKRGDMIEALKEAGDPLYDEYQRARHFSEALSAYLRESGRYDLTAVGDINTYQIFAGLVRQIVGEEGRVGAIVPSGIATDYYTQDYFNAIVDNRELVKLFDFENREQLFHGVDSRMKFCLLTLTGQGAPEQEIDFAFFLTQPEQLSEAERHFTLTRGDLHAMNPNTGACPTFRSKRDANTTRSLYETAVLVNEETGENPWGISLTQGLFHLTDDLKSGDICDASDQEVTGDGWIPLYEAKLTHQFDHRFATYDLLESELVTEETSKLAQNVRQDPEIYPKARYYTSPSTLENRIPESYDYPWFLVYRDVVRATDERTTIASVIPKSGIAYTLRAVVEVEANSNLISCLIAGFNSLPFDFAARQSTAGIHLSDYIMKQLPVHPPGRYTPSLLEYIVPRVLELTYTAWDLAAFADDVWSESSDALQSTIEAQWQANAEATDGGHRGATPPEWVERSDQADEEFPHPPFMWDEERRRFLRAELDALYGHLYGLSHDELDYVLETFPIVKKQDIEDFGDYRTKKLVLHCFDIQNAVENGTAYGPILDLPSIELGDIRPDRETERDEATESATQKSTSTA